MRRKYQKTTGYWVYSHTTPNKMVYIGMSKRQPCFRWHPLQYKTSTLAAYIEQYGWENIEHRVLIDGLTKKEAEQVEDWFICKATADGFCINERRSGGIKRDDEKAYYKQHKRQWEEDHKEHCKQYHKQYDKQKRSTPEGKIYNRVVSYNQKHPNEVIETPMMAKLNYIMLGIVPWYIKNDDLM